MSFVNKGGQNALWISDEKSIYGPQIQEKQAEKKDIAADYFCFSNHPFTANSIDSDSMALSVFLTLRLSNSLFLCPPGPKRNDSSAFYLSIKEPLTGNHSSWSPSLAFNFYKTYQSWQRGVKSLGNISKLRLKDITIHQSAECHSLSSSRCRF